MQTFEDVQVSDPGRIEQIEARLLAREFLYDNPSDYRDGVAAALEAVRSALEAAGDPVRPVHAHGC